MWPRKVSSLQMLLLKPFEGMTAPWRPDLKEHHWSTGCGLEKIQISNADPLVFCVPWNLFDFIDIMCIGILQGWQCLKAWASAKSGRPISSLKPIRKRWPGQFLVSWLLIFQQCWLKRGWLDLLAVCNVADRARRQSLIASDSKLLSEDTYVSTKDNAKAYKHHPPPTTTATTKQQN